MAVQSKFFQLTGQVLLEYKTDQYVILRNSSGKENKNFIMYKGIDGNQYCLLNENQKHGLYQKSDKFTQYYGGKNSLITKGYNSQTDQYGSNIFVDYYDGEELVETDFTAGTIIKNTDETPKEDREDQIYCDTIRLYLLTGYVMNSIGGYSVKVKGKVLRVSAKFQDEETGEDQTLVKRIDDYVYLLNWYMPKEELKDNIHWLDSPLYLNSKFYDRYIEITLPSAQDIAVNHRDIDYLYEDEDEDGNKIYLRGTIDRSSNIIVEFATVTPDNIELEDTHNSNGPSTFILDNIKQMSIYPESNANNFGVKLYEDVTTHSIIYHPTYGDGFNVQPVNIEIMTKFNNGEIPLTNYSEYDSANQGMDDFIEMYGEDVFKWIVINELSVTYIYNRIYHLDNSNSGEDTGTESYTDYYTNTIDYTGKTVDDGDFYITKFVPYIKERLNMNCKSIVIQYNCHLYNRMNNTDIVRSASMTIKNPYKYVLTSIDTTNVINYKIVNKIEKQNAIISSQEQKSVNSKIIREFYDVTELVANDGSENVYAQGKLTLKLNHSGSNYLIKLYTLNQDNTRVPYDLTGPWKYKLVFPSISGGTLDIFANLDNDKTNYGNGSLSFYISKDNAGAIMSVPASERYFSLMIDNDDTQNSTLYEGKVEWKA